MPLSPDTPTLSIMHCLYCNLPRHRRHTSQCCPLSTTCAIARSMAILSTATETFSSVPPIVLMKDGILMLIQVAPILTRLGRECRLEDVHVGDDSFADRQDVEAALHAVNEDIGGRVLSSWGCLAITGPRYVVTYIFSSASSFYPTLSSPYIA